VSEVSKTWLITGDSDKITESRSRRVTDWEEIKNFKKGFEEI